jgi:hypothetical protein
MLAPPLTAGICGTITRYGAEISSLYGSSLIVQERRCVAAPAQFLHYQKNALVTRGGRAVRPYKALPNQCSNCTVTVRVSGLMVMRNRFVMASSQNIAPEASFTGVPERADI